MRNSTLILSITAAAFAASTLYLALQLRAQNDAAAASTGSTLAASLAASAEPKRESAGTEGAARDPAVRASVPQSAAHSAAEPSVAGGASTGDPLADGTAVFARQQLARLTDPVQRAALLAGERANVRRQYARLREQLKLSDSTFGQLVDLLAEQQLQGQETYLRCAADPACNAEDNFKRHPIDDHSQELAALLGADQVDDLTKYQASLPERDSVAQLRGRLSDSISLRDDQAEALVLALADERDRYQKETAARGSKPDGWGTNLGMIWYSSDSNSIDQRLAEAAQYSQRLRERAGAVLSAAQLAAFNQMQDELLAQMAAYLRPASTVNKLRV